MASSIVAIPPCVTALWSASLAQLVRCARSKTQGQAPVDYKHYTGNQLNKSLNSLLVLTFVIVKLALLFGDVSCKKYIFQLYRSNIFC